VSSCTRQGLDALGVATIVIGVVVATLMTLRHWPPGADDYRLYRQRLGRAILLGLEAHELPYPERFAVPAATAELVNQARSEGHRIVAVGTTATRALESAADERGHVRASDGWTDLVIGPERGVRVVDGILSGWHEPEASHLLLLEAVAGRRLLERSYAAALAGPYRWHELGDFHLVLP